MFDMTLTLLRHPGLHPSRILCNEIVYADGLSDDDYKWSEEDSTNPDLYENWRDSRDPIVPEPREFRPEEIR